MFTQVDSFVFENTIIETSQLDVFRYRNFYNGGGVSIGDINGDQLPDIYLTSNLDSNRLFLNKGNLEFEDISLKSGTWGMKAWSTGVTMADVNGDGLLDIYVCNSGNANGDNRENELFINNGDQTFSEEAQKYGLADGGWSTHSVFFDYDLDGDLDCYVLNNSFRSVNSFDQTRNLRTTRHERGGDRLYRNTGEGFIDVSEESGIYGSEIAFGLGITVSDFNMDGWPDIYISNDFFERDYLYINQKDGTFQEELEKRLNHISEFSMGANAADLNNDGYPELFTTDMLPRTDYRLKTGTSFMTYDVQQARKRTGFFNQYMRNSLQLNNQNGTFSEIGLFSDVAATDWSWGAIIADFNWSGNKDIFVTNGIYRDVINQDFLNGFQEDARKILAGARVDYQLIVEKMPLLPLSNYMFVKEGEELRYHDVAQEWGLGVEGYSNGAAYGDLDNDGDLDLVINNVNQPAQLFRNNADILSSGYHYLAISFQQEDHNTHGLGAKVWIYHHEDLKFYEHFPIKGFQSSMDYKAIVGLGEWESIDSLMVQWPDGKIQTLANVKIDSSLNLHHKNSQIWQESSDDSDKLFTQLNDIITYTHEENIYVDFDYDRLLLEMNSRQGPAISKADLNGDGLDDLYLGGAMRQPGQLFVQNFNGSFERINIPAFDEDLRFEDVDSEFLDVDMDGDLDLYVVSGGSERGFGVSYQDRLYLNQGELNFVRSEESLPASQNSGSCVVPFDFDQDGDLDLFVGTRLDPNRYGVPVSSQLLENQEGKFVDVTIERIPQLKNLGMVTDAVWTDVEGDGKHELIIVGDWMPVMVFKNRGAGFQRMEISGLENSYGLWNTIAAKDINGDGLDELFVGNLGLNSRFKASSQKPLYLFINDYDNNGTLDPIYTKYDELDQLVPFSTKHQLTMQIPELKKKYLKFSDYAGKSMQEIFGEEALNNSIELKAEELSSMVYFNQGGTFLGESLPEIVQYSTVNTFKFLDDDGKEGQKLIVGGNTTCIQPEMGQYDANYGVLLRSVDQNFKVIPYHKSGLNIKGDVRSILIINSINDQKLIVFARNDEELALYKINQVSP